MASLNEALAAAVDHHQAGRWREATVLYTRVLAAVPGHISTLRLYGALLCQQGEPARALPLFARALAQQPDSADGWFDMARAALLGAAPDSGRGWLNRVLRLNPDHGPGRQQLAALPPPPSPPTIEEEMRQTAIALFHQGVARIDARQPAEAIARQMRVAAFDPANPAVLANIAAARLMLRDRDGGMRWAERAQRVDLADRAVLRVVGDAHFAREEDEQAVAAYTTVLDAAPDDADTRFNRACARLRIGDFAGGWADYECRWQSRSLRHQARTLPCPPWDGGDLTDRTILVHAEQGLGDAFQFCRYVWGVLARNPRHIYFEVHHAVLAVMADSFSHPNLTLLPRTADFPGHAGLPSADCHVPLMSLPRLLTGQSVPVPDSGYLHADAGRVAVWRDRLKTMAPHARLRVGLVWRGNPDLQHDDIRSANLPVLAPLAAVPGVALFSAQVGPDGDAVATAAFPVHDLRPWLNDFRDTAAAFTALDIVISVCTGPAHLAGGLGRPIWLLLPRPGEWRWGRDPTRSVWYPTARLFRQRDFGDWPSAVAAMADALKA